MFSFLSRNSYPLFLNKSLSEYCRSSTNESIKKMIERHNSKKDKPKIANNGNNPEFKLLDFIYLFSLSYIVFLMYKRIK